MDAICQKHNAMIGVASCPHCEIESLRKQLSSVAKERDEIAAQARMLDCMVDKRDEQLAAAEAAMQEMGGAVESNKAVERALKGVDYKGSYADGVELLKRLLAATLAACEMKDAALSSIIGATKSHVDDRDLLDELHPRHYMDIKVRRNGQDLWFEADWLSNLHQAIKSHATALAIKPDASALKAHDEALIERCAEIADKSGWMWGPKHIGIAIRELKGQL